MTQPATSALAPAILAAGTPTFFMNGARYDGSWANQEAFIGALREMARQGVETSA